MSIRSALEPGPGFHAGRPVGVRAPALPGLLERVLIGIVVIASYHQTPNVWFIRPSDFDMDFSNTIGVAIVLGICGTAFLRVAGRLNLLVRLVKLDPAIFLFVGLALASFLWSADPTTTLRRGIVFLAITLLACYVIIRFAVSEIIVILGWSFVASGLINLLFVVALPIYGIDEDGLWTGVFPQKNGLGYVAALAIPTLLAAARIRTRIRFLFYASAVLQLVLLIKSDSKTMLVVGLFGAVLMAVFNGLRGARTLRGAVLVTFVFSSIFSVAFATANIAVLADWLNKDVTLTGRLPFWQELWPIAMERVWLGYGFSAAFGGFFSPVHDAWINNQWAGDAHNAYLQLILELGVVGLVLFLASYVRAVLRAVKVVALVPGASGLWPLVVLSQAMIASVTESGLQSDSMGWLFYLLAAFASGAHLYHRTSLGMAKDPTVSGLDRDSTTLIPERAGGSRVTVTG